MDWLWHTHLTYVWPSNTTHPSCSHWTLQPTDRIGKMMTTKRIDLLHRVSQLILRNPQLQSLNLRKKLQ